MFELENKILKEYREYDNLNSTISKPLIKILVGYVKPSFLFKTKILSPIHLGRDIETEKCKDGIFSPVDLHWLHTNCIGDNCFKENISSLNRRIGFLTGTWWAYKNYNRLGDPNYFGSFGYRRLLQANFLENIKEYDFAVPTIRKSYSESLKDDFINFHGKKAYEIMIQSINKIYPNNNLEKYLKGEFGYYHELYILKKNLFFDFCDWIFPLLFELLTYSTHDFIEKKLNLTRYELLSYIGEKRDIAFICEIITGYYLYELTKKCIYIETKNILIDKESFYKKNMNSIFSLLRSRKKSILANP